MSDVNSVLLDGCVIGIPHTSVTGRGIYFSIASHRYGRKDTTKKFWLVETRVTVRVDLPKLVEVVCHEGDLNRSCRVVGRLEEEPQGKTTRLILVADFVEFRPKAAPKSSKSRGKQPRQ